MKKVKASKLHVGNIVRDCDGCVFEITDVEGTGNLIILTYNNNHFEDRSHKASYHEETEFDLFS